MSNSNRTAPEPTSYLIRHSLILAGTYLCLILLAIPVQAERPRRAWAQQAAVRNGSDNIHLNLQKLRTWIQTDLDPLPVGRTLPKEFKPLWKEILSNVVA